MTGPNGKVVRQLYDAFNAGNWGRADELTHADLVWIPDSRVGESPIEGRENVLRFFRDRAEMFDEFLAEVESLEEKDETVVAMLRVTGRGGLSGAGFELRIGHVWTVRDGVAVRGEGYGNRAEALRAAGLEP